MSYSVREVDAEYHERSRKSGRFPESYKEKVDTSKVNMEVIQRWIDETIHEQLPDDDIAGGFVYELLCAEENPDIVSIEQQVQEFIGAKESRRFCSRLWAHLLSAQQDPDGIPVELVAKRQKEFEARSKQQDHRVRQSVSSRDHRSRPKGRVEKPTYRAATRRKTNYNRSGAPQDHQRDHHDPRERGARDNTLL